jgi:hypothetical protein
MALVEPDHPLATDPTSPLIEDFKPHELNQIYRHPERHEQQSHAELAMAG